MRFDVPELEKRLGMGLYLTDTPGLGGRIKQRVEDFHVVERTNREEGEEGKYLIAWLDKRDWDTHHAVRDISRALHASRKRFGWAGTKDKRAHTRQKISIYDLSREELEGISIPGIELEYAGRSNKEVSLGDLWGNRFNIIIRDIDLDLEEARERALETTRAIGEHDGLPNYFGVQRFGARRPITHLIGEYIVQGDLKGAVINYIARSFPDEAPEVRSARDFVMGTRDYKEGLERLPKPLRYERAMLHHLVENPEDWAGALRALPDNLLRLFVHAYQSLLFNRMITERLQRGLPLNRAVPGDFVSFTNDVGLPDPTKVQRATEENLHMVNRLAEKGRAFVTAPLVGTNTRFAEDEAGEIELAVLEEESVWPEDFTVEELPEASSKGVRREIILPVDPEISVLDDELNEDRTAMQLEFTLPKGDYATTVLREYMKTEPLEMI